MAEVIVTDHLVPPASIEQEVLESVATVHCLQAKSIAELRGKLTEAEGLIVFHEITLPADLLAELSCCRVIVRCGVGYDNVDCKVAGGLGIPVCNVPDYGVDEVADHSIGLMIACNRGFIVAERRLRQHLSPWDCRAIPPVMRMTGATLGIIGCGRIGSATALRGKALGMKVIVYDPYLRPGMEKVLGVLPVDLSDLLAQSDIVSLHVPLSAETEKLIDAKALSMMKPSAILINTARGAVVDVDALAEVLRAGKLGGAGIDVLPSEPPPVDQPLVDLWKQPSDPPINLIITPHVAFYSAAGYVEMRTKAAQEILRVLQGAAPNNCVNQEWLTSV